MARKFETLKPEQVGRMVHVLLNDPRYKYHFGYRNVTGNRFTRKQVAEFIGVSEAEMSKLHDAYHPRQYPWMTDEEAARKLWGFAQKNGRWPRWKELLRRNGMPSAWRIYRTGSDVWEHVVAGYWNKMSPQLLMTIPNQTARRDAIVRYGPEKLLKKFGKFVQQDDFGTLWEIALGDDGFNDARFVEVVNKTARVTKGGKEVFDHYFLRVRPDMKTAKKAVEWTCQLGYESARTPLHKFLAET